MPRRPDGSPAAAPRQARLTVAALGLALGVLAGCAASPGRTPAAARTCGVSRTAANVAVIITVSHGTVSCATALRVENAYAAAVRAGRVRGTGGGAPVRVRGWTCQAFATPRVLKTGQTSECRAGGAAILAALPPVTPSEARPSPT